MRWFDGLLTRLNGLLSRSVGLSSGRNEDEARPSTCPARFRMKIQAEGSALTCFGVWGSGAVFAEVVRLTAIGKKFGRIASSWPTCLSWYGVADLGLRIGWTAAAVGWTLTRIDGLMTRSDRLLTLPLCE